MQSFIQQWPHKVSAGIQLLKLSILYVYLSLILLRQFRQIVNTIIYSAHPHFHPYPNRRMCQLFLEGDRATSDKLRHAMITVRQIEYRQMSKIRMIKFRFIPNACLFLEIIVLNVYKPAHSFSPYVAVQIGSSQIPAYSSPNRSALEFPEKLIQSD